MNAIKKKRVVVAMSGGVDSSVAAYLLKKEGYDVIGMTMQVFNQRRNDCESFGRCCSPDDVDDARRVAESLKIPFYVINLEKAFKENVIDYFADSYAKGKTPNPCIICNSKLKFEHLLKRAREIEAEIIATGHYARIEKKSGIYRLFKGKDRNKDQSYFLFNLDQHKLKHILFPLGNMNKSQIRQIAKEANLKTAQKGESQEICFVTEGRYVDFLEEYYKSDLSMGGQFVNGKGEVLGKHKGIHRYTIGQRRGLGISSKKPLYVIGIDKERNRVILGGSNELLKKEFLIDGATWIHNEEFKGEVKTKVRYRTLEALSKIEKLSQTKFKIVFEKEQKGITPGQAAVFYRGEEVLGGGWIV